MATNYAPEFDCFVISFSLNYHRRFLQLLLTFPLNQCFLTTMYRHEIVGTVTEVGSAVEDVKVGETVGVGCLVHSCHNCDSCEKGLEQYCESLVWTYNDVLPDGTVTQGGYSNVMVVNRK